MTEQKPEQALTTDFLKNYKSRLENLFKIEAGDNLTNKEYFSKFYTENDTGGQFFYKLPGTEENIDITDKLVLFRVENGDLTTTKEDFYLTFCINGFKIRVKHIQELSNNNIYIFARIFFFINEKIKLALPGNKVFDDYLKFMTDKTATTEITVTKTLLSDDEEKEIMENDESKQNYLKNIAINLKKILMMPDFKFYLLGENETDNLKEYSLEQLLKANSYNLKFNKNIININKFKVNNGKEIIPLFTNSYDVKPNSLITGGNNNSTTPQVSVLKLNNVFNEPDISNPELKDRLVFSYLISFLQYAISSKELDNKKEYFNVLYNFNTITYYSSSNENGFLGKKYNFQFNSKDEKKLRLDREEYAKGNNLNSFLESKKKDTIAFTIFKNNEADNGEKYIQLFISLDKKINLTGNIESSSDGATSLILKNGEDLYGESDNAETKEIQEVTTNESSSNYIQIEGVTTNETVPDGVDSTPEPEPANTVPEENNSSQKIKALFDLIQELFKGENLQHIQIITQFLDMIKALQTTYEAKEKSIEYLKKLLKLIRPGDRNFFKEEVKVEGTVEEEENGTDGVIPYLTAVNLSLDLGNLTRYIKYKNINVQEKEVIELDLFEMNEERLQFKIKKITEEQIEEIKKLLEGINEDIIGVSRVYLIYRDTDEFKRGYPGGGSDINESVKAIGDKLIKKQLEDKPNCVILSKAGCSGKNEIYGEFSGVLDNPKQEVIFNGLKTDGIIDNTIVAGGNLVLFGYGFSGSGKTYNLLSKANDSNLLTKITEYMVSTDQQITSVEFKELYPYNVYFNSIKINKESGDDNKENEENVIIEHTGLNNNGVGKNITTEQIYTRLAEIEEERIKKMRITTTPNNPESSRSHLFIAIKFSGGGQLTLIDMAGSENTSQIKHQFLVSDEIDKLKTVNQTTIGAQSFGAYTSKSGLKTKTISWDNESEKKNGRELFKVFNKDVPTAIEIFTKNQNDNIELFINFENFEKHFIKEKKIQSENRQSNERYKVRDSETGIKKEFYIRKDSQLKYLFNSVLLDINLTIALEEINYEQKRFMLELEQIDIFNYIEILKFFLEKVKGSFVSKKAGNKTTPAPTFTYYDLEYVKTQIDMPYLIIEKEITDKPTTASLIRRKERQNTTNTYNFIEEELISNDDEELRITTPFMYLFWYMERRLRSIFNLKTDKSKIINDGNIENDYLAIYYMFLTKLVLSYVNLVINQGKGIVSTLEHLKFFFLHNTPNQERLIQYNNSQTTNNRKFLHSTLTESQIYEKPIKFPNGKTIQEKVEMGKMINYKMIQLLLEYSTGVSKIDIISIFKKTTNTNPKYLTYNLNLDNEKFNKFVMMAHINRGPYKLKETAEGKEDQFKYIESEKKKYCSALKETVLFVNSIKSSMTDCKMEITGGRGIIKNEKTKKNNSGKRKFNSKIQKTENKTKKKNFNAKIKNKKI